MTATMVKERPVLYSGPMIQPIKVDIKTQTRRICRDQKDVEFFRWVEGVEVWPERWKGKRGEPYTGWVVKYAKLGGLLLPRSCPYGVPGDRLWVRESFSIPWKRKLKDGPFPVWYWADGNPERGDWTRPKPSIHMPRWASRLTLEIVNVRVEKLQEITEKDAIAEGAMTLDSDLMQDAARVAVYEKRPGPIGAVDYYRQLWNKLNAGRGFGWDANPWVWVVEFKRIVT